MYVPIRCPIRKTNKIAEFVFGFSNLMKLNKLFKANIITPIVEIIKIFGLSLINFIITIIRSDLTGFENLSGLVLF